jgi:alpha-glucosidase
VAVPRTWWRDAVIYQIYPRSYRDSSGDGIGDLRGITESLDHLEWLGVDALWLNPIMPSPNTDWGYDVSDYCNVHPELGSLDDFDELVQQADRRGIRILNDLVPNHTSDMHEWFRDARMSRDAAMRDRYVWADPKPDGSPPNNWMSQFGGEAWTLDETTGQYYLHLFLPTQPDLNWWNEDVADAFDEILRFWFDRGVAGFRLDVCHAIVKDRDLRDNPPADESDPPQVRGRGQRSLYDMNRPEVHDVLRRWRKIAKRYDPERLLVGETYVWDLPSLIAFYGARNDELQLAMNIPFVHSRFDAGRLSTIVDNMEKGLPRSGWPVWMGSNHDADRLASRWCTDEDRKIRCALMMLLTLRGTPLLGYGDEIGLPNVELREEQLRDPVGVRFWPAYSGRDPGRTPMQWTSREGAGFTRAGVEPWLPFGHPTRCNVADQRGDPNSVLHLCRDLIALRKTERDLRLGTYSHRASPEGSWLYNRGKRFVVALNMSDEPVKIPRIRGTVQLSTGRDRDGSSFSGGITLEGWEGVIVSRT